MTLTMRGVNTRKWFIGLTIFGGALVVIGFFNGGFSEAWFTLPAALAIAAFAWIGFQNPRLVLSPGGVRIINLFREFIIPWDDVAVAENRWGLYVHTRAGRKISVWALPSRAGFGDNTYKDNMAMRRAMDSGHRVVIKTPESEHELGWNFDENATLEVSPTHAANTIILRRDQRRSNAKLRRQLQAVEDWGSYARQTINAPATIVALTAIALCIVRYIVF